MTSSREAIRVDDRIRAEAEKLGIKLGRGNAAKLARAAIDEHTQIQSERIDARYAKERGR